MCELFLVAMTSACALPDATVMVLLGNGISPLTRCMSSFNGEQRSNRKEWNIHDQFESRADQAFQ